MSETSEAFRKGLSPDAQSWRPGHTAADSLLNPFSSLPLLPHPLSLCRRWQQSHQLLLGFLSFTLYMAPANCVASSSHTLNFAASANPSLLLPAPPTSGPLHMLFPLPGTLLPLSPPV